MKEVEFKNMSLNAESKILKDDLLNGDSSLLESREQLRKVTEEKIKYEDQYLKLTTRNEELEETKIELNRKV